MRHDARVWRTRWSKSRFCPKSRGPFGFRKGWADGHRRPALAGGHRLRISRTPPSAALCPRWPPWQVCGWGLENAKLARAEARLVSGDLAVGRVEPCGRHGGSVGRPATTAPGCQETLRSAGWLGRETGHNGSPASPLQSPIPNPQSPRRLTADGPASKIAFLWPVVLLAIEECEMVGGKTVRGGAVGRRC